MSNSIFWWLNICITITSRTRACRLHNMPSRPQKLEISGMVLPAWIYINRGMFAKLHQQSIIVVKFVPSLDNTNCNITWMVTYIFALDFIYAHRISLVQCVYWLWIPLLNIYSESPQINIHNYTHTLWKNCSRALPLHNYRSRSAESPFSRSDEKGSHRTPAWKLIILRVEKIDLVQHNDFPHRILRYLTYTCALFNHENTIVTAKIEKFRRCTHHGFILAA